jgi:hypothetical protein
LRFINRVVSCLLLILLSTLALNIRATEKLIIGNSDTDTWFPLTYVINGTFDVAQNNYWFNQSDFSGKIKTLNRRLENPHQSIKKDGGYTKFVQDEFLSTRLAPNILLHTLGGGYDALWLKEYYESKNISYPWLLSIVTSYAARYGNEVLEVSESQITSHDHIADLFIFDVAGLILATNKRAMKFITEELQMKAWHHQPMWNPERDDFSNAGLNYIIRPAKLSLNDKISPFFYFGMQNLLGLSYNLNDEKVLSGAMGVFLTDPLRMKQKWVTAIFYETNSNLALALFINGSENFRWRLNTYPALLNLKESWRVGTFLAQTYQDQMAFGVNLNLPFGIGHTF